MRRLFTTVLFTAFIFVSCQEDLTTQMKMGPMKDEKLLDATPSIVLRDIHSTRNVVVTSLPIGKRITKKMHLISSKGLHNDVVYEVRINPSLVDVFNSEHKTSFIQLPDDFYKLTDDNRKCYFPDGMRNSTEMRIILGSVNDLGETITPGSYILPIELSLNNESCSVLYYLLEIPPKYIGSCPLYEGEDFFIVFYVNTKDYQPMLASEWYNIKYSPQFDIIWEGAIGNIVNLRTLTIGCEQPTGRAILNVGSDMRYVLDHYTEYILPLQEQGRKVCLSLEGGGDGLGFCNLTDTQIDDFVGQVIRIVNQFGIDGINLWDRNSGYGLDGMPNPNTTSYPKLIKTLKKKLGSGRILTLTDYEDPTAYFGDVDAMGGIVVGEYLDFVWSGYNSKSEPYQIVDPYHQDANPVSTLHPRCPIAGLHPSKYGCINVTWYPKNPDGTTWPEIWDSEADILEWVGKGYKQNNIFVYDDLMTSLQNEYEGTWSPEIHFLIDDSINLQYEEQCFYAAYTHIGELPDGSIGYGKWKKNW